MKTNWIKILGAMCFLLGMQCSTEAQKFEDSFTRTASFGSSTNKVLVVDNINGHVTINGQKSNEVQVKVNQSITGESESDLEEGKKDLKFVVENKGDTIFIYIDSPNIHRSRNGKHYGWNWDHYSSVDYNFRYDITINTPSDIDLYVGTINKGDVTVADIYAKKMRAHNVNGDVILKNVTGATKATTVNGVVEVDYKENPLGNCKYSTINGDVKIKYQKNLSANLKFKSMHGEFFTDFNVSSYLPTKVEKESSESGGIKLVVDKYTAVQVGKGAHSHKFETLNGDVYIIRK